MKDGEFCDSIVWGLLAYDYRKFKLRLGRCRASAELRSSVHHCTDPPELRKDGQTGVNICRVIQLSIDQLDSTRVSELRTLRLIFKALMASISASAKSNEVESRLGCSLSESFVLGITAIPR
jgi:hypothetical protein